MSAVSVIVPARDASATIDQCLAALRRQDLAEPFEVIVVDDGSTDDTVARVRRAAGVRLLEQDGVGPASARNRGAAAAGAPVLAFTDADCAPEPGWLAAGLAAARRSDLVQGTVRPDPTERLGPFDRSLTVDHETGLYETANLFVRRDWFDRLGGFEAWLEPAVGKALAEDVWFGWRARRAGARIEFSPEARVHHAVFRRSAGEFVAERRRLVHFPAIAAKAPELRRHMFFARYFLSRRTAALDAAVLGAALAAAGRSPLPLVAGLPYAGMIARRSAPGRSRAPQVALVNVAADLVGLAALIRGSVERRKLLL